VGLIEATDDDRTAPNNEIASFEIIGKHTRNPR